jgi:hypothetical protein
MTWKILEYEMMVIDGESWRGEESMIAVAWDKYVAVDEESEIKERLGKK